MTRGQAPNIFPRTATAGHDSLEVSSELVVCCAEVVRVGSAGGRHIRLTVGGSVWYNIALRLQLAA